MIQGTIFGMLNFYENYFINIFESMINASRNHIIINNELNVN